MASLLMDRLISVNFLKIRKFVYVSEMLEMLIVRHLGTPNSGFNGCHCMRDPVLYRSMVRINKYINK